MQVMKFVWRHMLTLVVSVMIIHIVNFSNAHWVNIAITLLITCNIDFIKMQISFKSKRKISPRAFSHPQQLKNDNDPALPKQRILGKSAINWLAKHKTLSARHTDNHQPCSSATSSTPVFLNQTDWNGRSAGTTGYLGSIGSKYE